MVRSASIARRHSAKFLAICLGSGRASVSLNESSQQRLIVAEARGFYIPKDLRAHVSDSHHIYYVRTPVAALSILRLKSSHIRVTR